MSEPAQAARQNLPPLPAGAIVRVMPIINQKGLHARASAKFVQTVEKFDADVRVTRGDETVGGTSIMGLMMLAAAPGTSITVEATGNQAAEVIAALEDLLARRSARTSRLSSAHLSSHLSRIDIKKSLYPLADWPPACYRLRPPGAPEAPAAHPFHLARNAKGSP